MVIDALRDAGYQVTQTRTAEQFARLHITSVSKASVIVDMGVDWRMNQPTPLDIGPVLSLEDAVGNKVTLVVRAPERLCAWATAGTTAEGALRTASQVS